MALKQTAPPALEPVTLAEAKAFLRIGHAEEDALIGTLIIAARTRIETATGLALIQQGWTLSRDDWAHDGSIELPLAPLISITDVKVFGDDDVAAVIDPAHYYVDRVSRPPRLLLRGSRVWARPGRRGNGIEIAFLAGFGAAAANVPADLRQALLSIVAHDYAKRGDEADAGLPSVIDSTLQRYREVRL